MQGKLVAVTGGTGFLGRFIIASLIKAGFKVRMLVRSDPIHPLTPTLDAEIVLGDLSDQSALERLCTDADVIIHAAGLIKAKTRDAFFTVNVEGSRNLAKASAKVAPNARIVVVSSLAAREPSLSDYAASKHAGETEVVKNVASPVTILRPSAIYGQWDKETFPLFQMAAKGIVFGSGARTGRICLVNVRDVADAVAAFAKAEDASGTFEISDDTIHGYTWTEIVATAAKALKTKPRLITIPPRLFRAGAFLVQIIARATGKTPILTQGKVREILHADWSSSPQMQPPVDIWHPKVNLTDGFADTAEWYHEQRWL